ncbi:MAG: hypothetical protein RI885_2611 [Actinomycetota bacterium]
MTRATPPVGRRCRHRRRFRAAPSSVTPCVGVSAQVLWSATAPRRDGLAVCGGGYCCRVVTALYRRYRPETFAELIGQSQVTDPLRTALRSDRVNHAYLFSGPRGCGKTTSARILARCLNCAEGPTDTPCGVCPSCVELSRDGSGSLDVVEIDAASHGGVEDARDLRERAIFAPARDRYKIFILDEAHMVTASGFNALLKIVEEPPEHVKFIFATTEPDKVIGTIRSRTHHYPFRLVPPAQMLDYIQQLSASEHVEVEPGVLPLVVRAGGGSVRDTLSLLDQLIAGSEGATVQYERAVALLGYTHGTLLAEVVDALAASDAAAAFTAVDRVIQTGQDPRRFVEDLLEYLRDLIIVAAVSADAASAVLRGVQQEDIERMSHQATRFGSAELSRAADVVNSALTEMTGATSPRLHLELMIARVLVPASDDTERGALARVERLERRIGVVGVPALSAQAPSEPAAPTLEESAPVSSSAATPGGSRAATPSSPPAPSSSAARPGQSSSASQSSPAAESSPAAPPSPSDPSPLPTPAGSPPPSAPTTSTPVPSGEVTLQQLKDAWPEILRVVEKAKRSAWVVVYGAHPTRLDGDVLFLTFPSERDVETFKQQSAGEGPSEYLRRAIVDVLGVRVKYVARVDVAAHAPATSTPAAHAPATPTPPSRAGTAAPTTATAKSTTTWATVAVPNPTRDDEGAAGAGSAAAAPAGGALAAAASGAVPAASATGRPGVGRAEVPTVIVDPADVPVDDEDREPEPEFEAPTDAAGWAVSPPSPPPSSPSQPGQRPEPGREAQQPQRPQQQAQPAPAPAPAPAPRPSAGRLITPKPDADKQRYGESVVREILGASFIEEQPVTPRVTPTGD